MPDLRIHANVLVVMAGWEPVIIDAPKRGRLTGRRRAKLLCAVPRRASSAGANPARHLSFQPVAVGAAMEATKSSKPSTQRVASGDSASRQAVT